MEAIKAAIGDGVLTFMWVFVSSMFGLLTSLIAAALGVEKLVWASLFITTLLIFVFVFLFSLIGEVLGGASFNPTGTAAFYAAGVGGDSLFSMALRFPAQVYMSIHTRICLYACMYILCMCMYVFFVCLIDTCNGIIGLAQLLMNHDHCLHVVASMVFHFSFV